MVRKDKEEDLFEALEEFFQACAKVSKSAGRIAKAIEKIKE